MSTTVIDNLQADGATPPTFPYIRTVGGVDSLNDQVRPVSINFDGAVQIIPSRSTSDAFNRMRVSSAHGLFDSKQIYALDTLFWENSLTTGGTVTYLTNQAAAQLEVTTVNGSSAIRQTRRYMTYQPGRSQLIFMTGMLGALKTNVRQRIGYFDSNNGVFFEQDGVNLKVVRRTFVTGSAVDNVVNQSSWNIDPLDGTGISGITINMADVQVFVFDFSWLGSGNIRLGFLFQNIIVYCHQFITANLLTTVSMSTPTLPVRYEITNIGVTASNTTMTQICAAVISEDSVDPVGLVINANTGAVQIQVPAEETALMGLRLSATYNRATIIPLIVDAMTTSANNLMIRIYVRATLTGGAWVATTGVASEVNITPTGFSNTGAILIGTFYLQQTTGRSVSFEVLNSLNLVSNFAGTPDELIVTSENVGTGNSNMFASITWKELY